MKKIHWLLLAIILIGIGVRFVQIDAPLLNGDEEFYIVAAQKFHAGSDYDVRLWNFHAPPVAKYIMSLSLTGSQVDYSIPYAIPPNLWVYNYLAYDSIAQVYPLIRLMSALFGALFIVLVFLIGRELFGRGAGLWAAASAAISIDFLILSRVVLVDIYLYAFIASTVYFFIKYRNSPKPLYLAGLFISLILMFGSKNAQWLVVIPPLLYVEIIGNKKHVLKTINFLIIMGVAWFIHSSFIYPPEFSVPAQEFFTEGANKNIIEPHLDTVFLSFVSINSFFYLALFIAVVLYYLRAIGVSKKRIDWGKVRNHLVNPSPYSFIIFVAITSLVVFMFTSLSINSKYIGQTSIPFFILSGFVATFIWKKPKARPVLVVLILIGAISAVAYLPSYEDYPGQQIIRFASPGKDIQPTLDILEARGNPTVITNTMNLLIFYEGDAFPIPTPDSPSCTQQLLDDLRASGTVAVFRNVGEVEKQFLCSFVFQFSEEQMISDSYRIASFAPYSGA